MILFDKMTKVTRLWMTWIWFAKYSHWEHNINISNKDATAVPLFLKWPFDYKWDPLSTCRSSMHVSPSNSGPLSGCSGWRLGAPASSDSCSVAQSHSAPPTCDGWNAYPSCAAGSGFYVTDLILRCRWSFVSGCPLDSRGEAMYCFTIGFAFGKSLSRVVDLFCYDTSSFRNQWLGSMFLLRQI